MRRSPLRKQVGRSRERGPWQARDDQRPGRSNFGTTGPRLTSRADEPISPRRNPPERGGDPAARAAHVLNQLTTT